MSLSAYLQINTAEETLSLLAPSPSLKSLSALSTFVLEGITVNHMVTHFSIQWFSQDELGIHTLFKLEYTV